MKRLPRAHHFSRQLSLAALMGLLTLAGATSAPRLTLDQQAVKADLIVRATVEAPSSVQESGQTWTVYPLTVLETLAGDAQSLPLSKNKPSVWVLGGLQDGPLLTGGEMLLLLYKSRYDSPLVGFNQGFYTVQGAGNSKVVLNLPEGTPGVTPVAPAPGSSAPQGTAAPAAVPVDAASVAAPATPAPAPPAQPTPAQPSPSPVTPSVSPAPAPATGAPIGAAAVTPPTAPGLPPPSTALDKSASVSASPAPAAAAAPPAAPIVLVATVPAATTPATPAPAAAVPASANSAPASAASASAGPANTAATPAAASLAAPAPVPATGTPTPAAPNQPAPTLLPAPAPAAPLPGQMSLEAFRKAVLDARAKAGK